MNNSNKTSQEILEVILTEIVKEISLTTKDVLEEIKNIKKLNTN